MHTSKNGSYSLNKVNVYGFMCTISFYKVTIYFYSLLFLCWGRKNCEMEKNSLTMVFHRRSPIVEISVVVELHHFKVHPHIQENIWVRKWADVEESSLFCSLDRHITSSGCSWLDKKTIEIVVNQSIKLKLYNICQTSKCSSESD